MPGQFQAEESQLAPSPAVAEGRLREAGLEGVEVTAQERWDCKT